jgi:nicotinamide-nucleotide amidase
MFNKGKTTLFSLPGVPFEMKELLCNEVIPYINRNYTLQAILHRTILIVGIPESDLADKLKNWEENLGKEIKVAYLPSPGLLRLRLSISGFNVNELNNRLEKEVQEITALIGENAIFGFDSDALENIIGKMLIDRNMSLSIAESCTGGKISQLITSVPGCSEYFKGSIVAYSNEIKSNYLDVPIEIIRQYGAVSREVAEYMVKGVQKLLNSDCAIATTGIAGPDGGTNEKPVGTIWISVISGNQINSEKFMFGDNRERNIIRASLSALNMLRNLLKEKR